MKRTLLVVSLLLLASNALAETHISVFAHNPTVLNSTTTGTDVLGGVGLAVNHFFTPHVSMELSVTMNKSNYVEYFVGLDDSFRRRVVRSYPVDLIGAYHFTTSGDWTPYVGLGARWVSRPSMVAPDPSNELNGQIAVGTTYDFTKRVGIRFDAKYVPLGDLPRWDDRLRLGAGISWRF